MAATRRLRRLSSLVADVAELPDGPLLVALSGGADSAVCGWVAARSGAAVRAVHVHHGLPASDRLAEAAEAVAGHLGVPFEVVAVDVGPGASPEGRARAARYRALEERRRPDEWVLTGHTRDDQAETVLHHLLRGSGPRGLAGIPSRRPPFARPLLGVPRAVTRELATLLGLPFMDDPANDDPAHLRNRIRSELLPAIEARIAPGARRTLARTAELLREEVEAWEGRLRRLPFDRHGSAARLPRGVVRALDRTVAAEAVRALVAHAGAEYPLPAREVTRILGLVDAGSGSLELAGGLKARLDGPWLEVSFDFADDVEATTAALRPGRTIRWGRWRFDARIGEPPRPFPLSPWTLTIPAPGGETRVRRVRAGDRIALGHGSKRVLDALAEAGVPPWERPGWPVLETGGRILWIPGVRRAAGSLREDADGYLSVIVSEEERWTG